MTNKNYNGGCVGGVLPFPLGETRSSDFSELDKLLGRTFPLGESVEAVLVQANAALSSCASLCLEWQDDDAFEVQATTQTGDEACGVCPVGQDDVAANGYFLMLRPSAAGAVITMIASAAISKGAQVQPTASGQIVTDSAFETTVSVGQAMEAATSAGDTVMVRCSVEGFYGDVA